MKKIAFITPTGDIDIRLYKFLKYFIGKCEVFLLSPEYKKIGHKGLFKDLDDKKINKIDIAFSLNANFPYDIHRNRRVREILLNIQPDFIVCRDIMISGFLTTDFKKELKAEFILDVCDSFPEVLTAMFGYKGKVLSYFANKVEKKALKLFDKVCFVSPEAKKYIFAKHNLNKSSYILENVPYKMEKKKQKLELKNNKMVYLGTINERIRDLETVFEGISLLKTKFDKNFSLDIYYFENQVDIKERYETLVSEKQLSDEIKFKKAVSNENLNRTLKDYSIGLVPHCRNFATDFTIPNKIYDYIASDIYILASNNPSLERLLEFWSVGSVYEGGNARDFANTLLKLCTIIETKSADIQEINHSLNWEFQINGLIEC